MNQYARNHLGKIIRKVVCILSATAIVIVMGVEIRMEQGIKNSVHRMLQRERRRNTPTLGISSNTEKMGQLESYRREWNK